jgi:TPR repeat protein
MPRDYKRAFALFEQSCSVDDASACGNLAMLVDDGRGVRRNRQRALELFDKACGLGEAESCFTLGRAYQIGKGIERNNARAIELLERALKLDPDTESTADARRALKAARDEAA